MSHTTTLRAHPILVSIGLFLLFFGIAFTCRVVWEETSLTWQQGPQMVGFSLAHGYYAPLMLAPFFVAVWLIVAVIAAIVDFARKQAANKVLFTAIGISVAMLGTLSLPGTFWQWAFIGSFAKSPHANDLMTYDAAEGAMATVRAYLDRNVPIESKNYEGSTAAFTAAAGGSVNVLRLLAERGADLNAVNSYGDSPLAAAIGNKHQEAAEFLRDHHAKQITGTHEQHEAATKAIVDREIERENRLK
jgi:hypothetical protein